MATSHGPAAPALTALSRMIREYSVFQAVAQIIERLREAHPSLDEEALYDQLEFQANPGFGFPGNDIDRVEFLSSTAICGHAFVSMCWGCLVRGHRCQRSMASKPLPTQWAVIRRVISWIFFTIACTG